MAKNTQESADAPVEEPVVTDDINQDPQPARDQAAAEVAAQTGQVTVRLLSEYQDAEGTKLLPGALVKTQPETAAGLIAAGIADADDDAVRYAIESGAETHEI